MDEKERDPLDPENDADICTEMERNFTKVVSELVGDRSLDKFRKEYELLHDALLQSHEHNTVLIDKCRSLNQEIVSNANKISQVLNLSQNDQRTIQNLRMEFEKAWNLVQDSEERENQSQAVILNLHLEIQNLKELIEKATKSNIQLGEEMNVSYQDAQKDYLSVKSDVEIQLEQVNNLIQQIDETRSNTNKLKVETIDLKGQFHDLEEESRIVNFDYDQILKERLEILDSCQKQNDEIKTVSTSANDIKTRIKETKENIRKRKQTIIQCNKDKDILNELTAQVRVRSERQYQRYLDVKNLTKSSQNRLKEKTNKISEEDDNQIKLERELKQLDQEQENITQDLNEFKEIRKEILSDKEETFSRLKALRQEHYILNSKISSALLQIRQRDIEVSRVSNEDRTLQQKIASQQIETKQCELQIANINNTYTQLKKSNQDDKEQAMKYEKAINQFENERFFSEAQAASVNEEVRELKRQIDNSELLLQTKNGEIKHHIEKVKEITEEKEKILKEVLKIQKENESIINEIKPEEMLLASMKEGVRQKDEECISLHISYKQIQKLIKELKKEITQLENDLREATEREKQLMYQVKCSEHIYEQANVDIENTKKTIHNIELQNRDIVKGFEKKKIESDSVFEKNRVLQSIIRMNGHKYQIMIEKVNNLKNELENTISRRNELEIQLRGQNLARSEIRRLEKLILQSQGQIKAMEDELEMPRNVHRWHLLQSTHPVQYQYVLMRLSLLDDITKQISVYEKVVNRKRNLEEKVIKLRKNLKTCYGSNYDTEYDTLNSILKQKTRQLKEMEEQAKENRPQIEEEREQVKSVRSMIRESKQFTVKRNQANEKVDFIREPKYVPTKRAPCRYMGGGFEVGMVVDDLIHHPKPPSELEAPRSARRHRNRKKSSNENFLFEIPEIRMNTTRKKTYQERMNAVVVPTTSSSMSNSSSLSVSSSNSSMRSSKKKNSQKPKEKSRNNWLPKQKNSSRRHFIAQMQNDCL